MKYTIQKNIETSWDLIPETGAFQGRVIATAEGVNLTGATFAHNRVRGAIRSLWGLTILIDDVYADPETLRSLNIGGTFHTRLEDIITLDGEGFKDSFSMRLLKSAKHVMMLSSVVYAKGYE